MNNKKHVKSKIVPPKHLNNEKHAKTKTVGPPKVRVETFVPKPKQKVIKAVYKVKCSVVEKVNVIETKTTSPPKVRVETSVPKPKQKVLKVVYQVKCPVIEKADSVKIKNFVLHDKRQFFKYVGANQVWVLKKV